ncbi:dihydrofolate reductase family protein [Terasakiella pusilla]|uniref:dihydrofolate reductase family protein n=1 Tax=Terasakiella pusilla TaxID=64973 RepID=UPI003AA8F699
MTTGHIFIATSLDGFIARTDHQLDWLIKQPSEAEDHGYEAFISNMDGLIMGRGSFETLLSFNEWPYKKPTIVMSKSLTPDQIPKKLRGKVTLTRQKPEELMEDLAWSKAYIDGGKVIQSFINAGLIEDMIITTVPILIGDGISLFGSIERDIDLKLISSNAFKSGMVQNHYQLLT